MSDKIVTLFKKIDSEVVKSMIYDRDKKRMMGEGWLETHAEAEAVVVESTESKDEGKGAEDGDDSSTTTKAVATGNTGSGVRGTTRS